MNEPRPARPLWLYVVGAVLFAVVGTTVVVVLNVRGVLPVAGPFVVVALLPLLGLLRVGVLSRRVRRRHQHLTELLGNLGRLAAAERATAYDQRPSRASDRSLAEAITLAHQAQAQLQARDNGSVRSVDRLGQLAHGWAPGAPLSRQVQQAVEAALQLNLTWADVSDAREAS